ncbi:MAG TPA: NfeD family protein [Lacunisphaera sp.]|nr:NfeD family protein [Lacunisphaera sp.]
MTGVVIFFVLGLTFLALEMFFPGAVMGIIGGLAMLVGAIIAFANFGAAGGTLALASAIALVLVALYLEFVLLPRTRLARSLTMSTTVGGTSQPALADLQAVVDQVGEAETTLAPSGYITLQGRRYEAFSRSGMLARGTSVRVTGLDNFRLIVIKNQSI